MRVAIIPARGGSKRVPRKNIRDFCGKPMIAYAIERAQRSELFDRIVVSTDDEEIAQTAMRYGVEVPFTRPPDLSDDFTPTVPVISHAISVCLSLGWQVHQVCCIYPAAPFLQAKDLVAALAMLEANLAGYSFTVTRFPSPIQRALRQLPSGAMEPVFPQYSTNRTQDLEPAYYDAGQFYWAQAQTWLEGKEIHKHGSGLVIPNWRVVDIDTNEDWLRAEMMFKALQASEQICD